MTTTSTNAPQGHELRTTYAILAAISLCHLTNDLMQSVLAAIYPLLKTEFSLDFWHIGLLTLVFQLTASLLQPLVGIATDRHPFPWALPIGMGSTMIGLLLLSVAPTYGLLICGAGLIGIGSSIFHPEASRVARAASGGRFGLAQSTFQVGGNFGTAIGPLLAALIVVPLGRGSVAIFAVLALVGMAILTGVSRWHVRERKAAAKRPKPAGHGLPARQVRIAMIVLLALLFSKQVYMASMTSYYTFFLIERFGLTPAGAQKMLFLFLVAVAFGTVIGGPVGDRIGRRTVIWVSILGVLPLTLLLPYASLFWTGVLSVLIGVVLASALPAIIVFAQELAPGRVGTVAGLFFGAAFGVAGIAAAALGLIADSTGITLVFQGCALLPALGLLAAFLPRRGML